MVDLEDADDPLMSMAWAAFLRWAGGEPNMLAEFTADTGMKFAPPTTGIERLIDAATGYGQMIAREFAIWATVKYWGLDAAPVKFRRMVEARPVQRKRLSPEEVKA